MITHVHGSCPACGQHELYQAATGRECLSCGFSQIAEASDREART
jgi:uncharacterized protein (DUF983 family)